MLDYLSSAGYHRTFDLFKEESSQVILNRILERDRSDLLAA